VIVTPLCELLGIRHPIVQGGMAWVSTAELVVAVSEAGGLGIIGAGNAPPDYVRDQVRSVKDATDKPYAVNVPLFSPFVEPVLDVCIEEGVPVVATGAGSPAPYIPRLKEAGIKIMTVVASVALARRLEQAGADVIVAEGMEAGGHIGDVAALPLVPQVVDAVDVPVVAAGGIADGRGLAAALALGAAGIQMGTRFICSNECTAHPNYKAKICRAGDRATVTTGRSIGHPVRALRNPMVREFARLEKEGIPEEKIIEFGTGRLRLAAVEGDTIKGSLMAGQSAGLVRDVVPARELIEGIVADAETILSSLLDCVK